MAFQNRNQNQNTNWMNDAFINLYVPSANGRSKLGSIGLKLSNPNQEAIIKFLRKEGDKGIEKLLQNVEVDFREVTGEASVDPNAWMSDDQAPEAI